MCFVKPTLVNTLIVRLRNPASTSSGIVSRWAIQSRIHSRVSLRTWTPKNVKPNVDNQHAKCIYSACGVVYLFKRMKGMLGVVVFVAEGLDILAGDNGFFKLLKPRPHQAGKHQGISFHAYSLPCPLSAVKFSLQDDIWTLQYTYYTQQIFRNWDYLWYNYPTCHIATLLLRSSSFKSIARALATSRRLVSRDSSA